MGMSESPKILTASTLCSAMTMNSLEQQKNPQKGSVSLLPNGGLNDVTELLTPTTEDEVLSSKMDFRYDEERRSILFSPLPTPTSQQKAR